MTYNLNYYNTMTKIDFRNIPIVFNIYPYLNDQNTQDQWFISVEKLRKDGGLEFTGLQCNASDKFFFTKEEALTHLPVYIDELKSKLYLEEVNNGNTL